MKSFFVGLIPVFLVGLTICLISLVAAIMDPTFKHYHAGDCFVIGEKPYQVKQIGRYSIKAITPHYEGFEDALIDQTMIDKSVPVDCFDYFQVKEKP